MKANTLKNILIAGLGAVILSIPYCNRQSIDNKYINGPITQVNNSIDQNLILQKKGKKSIENYIKKLKSSKTKTVVKTVVNYPSNKQDSCETANENAIYWVQADWADKEKQELESVWTQTVYSTSAANSSQYPDNKVMHEFKHKLANALEKILGKESWTKQDTLDMEKDKMDVTIINQDGKIELRKSYVDSKYEGVLDSFRNINAEELNKIKEYLNYTKK